MTDFRMISFDFLNCNSGFILFTNADNDTIKDSIDYFHNLEMCGFENSEIIDHITTHLIGCGCFVRCICDSSQEFDEEFYFDIYQLVKIGLYVDLDICEIRTPKNNN